VVFFVGWGHRFEGSEAVVPIQTGSPVLYLGEKVRKEPMGVGIRHGGLGGCNSAGKSRSQVGRGSRGRGGGTPLKRGHGTGKKAWQISSRKKAENEVRYQDRGIEKEGIFLPLRGRLGGYRA